MKKRNRIEEIICAMGAGKIKIPRSIIIDGDEDEDIVRLTLNANRLQTKNMQEDGNAFEGWALCSHTVSQKDVIICVDGALDTSDGVYVGKGHMCRFLYRIMKFSEQYDWVHLSEYLEKETERFREYLSNGVFYNNIGNGEAGNKGKYDDENAVEAKLAEDGILRGVIGDIGEGKVYRQLPVGLFEESVARDNAVFTGVKSAIDLWSVNGNTINIIELKTKNPMIGIVTEIFFYSNYVYDLVSEDGLFTLNEQVKGGKSHRGYEEILKLKEEKSIKIQGIMLADDFHPCVKDCCEELNKNNMGSIQYSASSYRLNVVIDKYDL